MLRVGNSNFPEKCVPHLGQRSQLNQLIYAGSQESIPSAPSSRCEKECDQFLSQPAPIVLSQNGRSSFHHLSICLQVTVPESLLSDHAFLQGQHTRPLSDAPFATRLASVQTIEGPITKVLETCPSRMGSTPRLEGSIRAGDCRAYRRPTKNRKRVGFLGVA